MNERKYPYWLDWVRHDESLGEPAKRTTKNALLIYRWPSDEFYKHFYGIWDFLDVPQSVERVVKDFHEFVDKTAMPLIERQFTLVPILYKSSEYGERRWVDTFDHIPGYTHCHTEKCNLPQTLSFLVYVQPTSEQYTYIVHRDILKILSSVPFYTYNIEIPKGETFSHKTLRKRKDTYMSIPHIRKMTGLYDVSDIMPVRVIYWLHVTESYLRNDARWFIYGT